MQNWNKELLKLNSEQWEEAMNTTDNFCSEIRSKDDVDSNVDLEYFNACMGSSTERVEKVLSCITSRGYIGKNMSALDIGSGNGVFTIPFAKEFAKVTSLDVVRPMQDVIRQRAKEEGITNIEYVTANWREMDLDTYGMRDYFDLVLCSINPRAVCNFETLNKMNQASKAGCCLMTFAGRKKGNHGEDLQKIILGKILKTTGGNDIIFPFNVIYHMGGEPELSYSKVSWEYAQNPNKAVENICHSYWRFVDIDDDIRKKVEKYVMENLEDGMYVDRSEHLIGIMVWDAWRIKDRSLA